MSETLEAVVDTHDLDLEMRLRIERSNPPTGATYVLSTHDKT